MKVYIEESLTIAFFLTYLILKISAIILRKKGRVLPLVALLSSLINLFQPMLILSVWTKLCFAACQSLLVVMLAFKYKNIKDFALTYSLFILTTFLLGGGCLALKQLVGDFPVFIVAVIGLSVFVLAYAVNKGINHHRRLGKFTYNLTIKDGDKKVCEQAYLDSGNVLYDNITKKPIVLVSFDVFHKLYENISYLTAFTQKLDSSSIKNGHYIKINSVGKGTSILVFTVDCLAIEGDERQFKDVSLGLSFSGFERSFGKNILLHCDYS